MVIDDAIAPLVRTAFEMAARRELTLKQIAETLAAQGLRGKRGELIGTTGVWAILTNRLYTGANPKVPAIYTGTLKRKVRRPKRNLTN